MSTGILDTYTARIAYALRRLKSTYSGNCLRVRRSSDDTEQDIGFDSDGIINWSDASSFAGGNDLFVVKHYDQSGNGNHRSQATNSKQPKLNLSTHQIEFDGTDDYLATESAVDLSATDKLSFYTKLKRLGSTGTYQFFAFTEGASIGGNGLQCYFYHTSSKYTIYDSNTAANTREDSTSISGAGTERLISVIIDRALTTSSEMLFYADNTSQTGGSAGNNSGNFPSAIWQFCVYSATMFFGNYQQSEFILFDSAHDGTDRTFIESDISSGLGATPPPVPPTVSITSPSTGGASISGNQNIVVSCADNIGVTQLDLMVDGEVVDTYTGSGITSHTFTLDTLRFANGDHVIKVRASDGTSTTDSSTITKTFANTFTITGDAKLPSSGSDIYTTNIPDPVWSKDSGGGSINASTGEYTAPSSGLGVAVLRATGEFNSTQTKNVLYGFPYVHNNGNSREFPYSELPEGYQFKARVKSEDEQGNTLGFTGWEEQP